MISSLKLHKANKRNLHDPKETKTLACSVCWTMVLILEALAPFATFSLFEILLHFTGNVINFVMIIFIAIFIVGFIDIII